jgi:hypothetical protein
MIGVSKIIRAFIKEFRVCNRNIKCLLTRKQNSTFPAIRPTLFFIPPPHPNIFIGLKHQFNMVWKTVYQCGR